MRCQTSSRKQCEKATSELFGYYTQFYFPKNKFGSLSNFVCEFIESNNGIIYLSQVRAFECDFKIEGQDIRYLNMQKM
jgi:hypothetical protein